MTIKRSFRKKRRICTRYVSPLLVLLALILGIWPSLAEDVEIPGAFSLDPACALYKTDEAGTRSVVFDETYTMVSLPVEAHRWLLAQLDVSLGGYDPLSWRIFRYDPYSEAYDECGDIQDIKPGLGYWIISGSELALSLDGWCTTEAYKYPLELQPGWNQIGNPFEETIAWRDVDVYDNQGEELIYAPVLSQDNNVTGRTLWAYNADSEYVSSDRLRTFEGYWVKNHTDHEIFLLIPSPLEDRPSNRSASTIHDEQEEEPPSPPGGSEEPLAIGGGGCFLSTGIAYNR
jgi:hypothetical protein